MKAKRYKFRPYGLYEFVQQIQFRLKPSRKDENWSGSFPQSKPNDPLPEPFTVAE